MKGGATLSLKSDGSFKCAEWYASQKSTAKTSTKNQPIFQAVRFQVQENCDWWQNDNYTTTGTLPTPRK